MKWIIKVSSRASTVCTRHENNVVSRFCFHLRSTSLFSLKLFFFFSAFFLSFFLYKTRRSKEKKKLVGENEKKKNISVSEVLKRNKALSTDRSECSLSPPHFHRNNNKHTNEMKRNDTKRATAKSGIISKTKKTVRVSGGTARAFYKRVRRRKKTGEDERRNNNNLRCRMKIIHFIRRKERKKKKERL